MPGRIICVKCEGKHIFTQWRVYIFYGEKEQRVILEEKNVCFDDDDATCGSNENVFSFKNAPLVDVIFWKNQKHAYFRWKT